MYMFTNAWKSITRSKGRNILMGIIVLIIATASCISLAIDHAATALETQGMQSQSLTATINVDREKLMASMQDLSREEQRATMQKYQALPLDEMQVYSTSSVVKSFNYVITSSINASGELEAYDSTATATATPTPAPGDNQNNQNNQGNPGGGNGDRGPMGMRGDFNIIGYSAEDAMTGFIQGTQKITSGQMFDVTSANAEVIISSDLATYNGLTVGSVMTLANPNVAEETYEFTVVGIYTNTNTSTSGEGVMFSTAQEPANQIYTSYAAIRAVIDKSIEVATVTTNDNGRESTTALRQRTSGSYVLANVADLEQFKKDTTTLGLDPNYAVTSPDITNFEQSLVPLQNLSKFATTLLWIVLVIGSVILVVLNLFNIRERKYEIGVLTAIGMKKYKVATQLVVELFIVTIVALMIGTAIGSVAAVPTANQLLSNQVTAQQSLADEQSNNFGRPQGGRGGFGGGGFGNLFGNGNQDVSYISNIDAVVNLDVVWQLLGIGVILTILSSLIALIFVMRYEPLKILANRS